MKQRISIIIPAYNEAERIGPTLRTYDHFFKEMQRNTGLEFEILVALNGCTDTTVEEIFKVVYPSILKLLHVQQLELRANGEGNELGERSGELHRTGPSFDELERALKKEGEKRGSIGYEGSAIRILNLHGAGKGYAIKHGFLDALKRDNTLIGFVDADMATAPEYFFDLIKVLEDNSYDGAIASRYTKGASVTPPRPFIKRWGSKIFYETLVRALFGIYYDDYQCGAKVFKRAVIEKVVSHLHVTQWAFDVELLYLCKVYGFIIKEVPTVWHDQAGSKLDMLGAGTKMLSALVRLRWFYYKKRNEL